MLGIEHFLAVAEHVLGIEAGRLARVTRIGPAESALAAPYASFAGRVLYPHPVKRASVLASRIVRNHPLPDGNKRVAFILMDLALEESGYALTATPAEIDGAFRALAARALSEEDFHAWLLSRIEHIEKKRAVE